MFAAIRKHSDLCWLLGIVLLGLVLRLWGIEHGFPFIFHIDEPAVVRSALAIRFEANPKHFDWPHLHFYLNYGLYFLFIKFRGLLQTLGFQSTIATKFPLFWQDPLVFYWISRVFDAVLGALTAIPVFLAGKELFGRRARILAALAIVLMPLHVHVSHFALIDVPTAFWVAWVVYFSSRAYNQPTWKNYALAGAFVGLAASTKYHGGLAAAVVFTAWVLSSNRLKNLKNLVLAGLTSLLGFIVGTPYALFDFKTFSRSDTAVGAFWQFENVGSADFATHIRQFAGALTTTFAGEFGHTFIAMFLVFIAVSIYGVVKAKSISHNSKNWLVIIPALFLFFYISGFDKLRSHYFIPIYPFVAISAGAVAEWLISSKRKILALVVFTVFAIPAFLSFQRSQVLAAKDTRVLLYEWLEPRVGFNDYMVYNSSSVEPIVEKVSKDLSEKGLEDSNLRGRKGFIIVYADEDGVGERDQEFVARFNKAHEISAQGRRGGNILIYEFNQAQ